jgi:hypothetical protein
VCCGFAPHCAQKGVFDGTGVTKNPTVTVAGDPMTPDAVIIMWPVTVPTGRAPSIALICKVCGAVPLVGVTVSHGESLAAVKVSVPPPIFETVTEAGAGFAPPCTVVKDSEAADRERIGAVGGGVTTPMPPQPTTTEETMAITANSAMRFMLQSNGNYDYVTTPL